LVAIGAAACGDIEDQSLCQAFDEYLATAAVVQASDPAATSASEAADLAQEYLDRVQRLQEISDDQDSIALVTLEAAVNDIVVTLEAVPEDADDSTWEPLIDDSYDDAADAAVTVRDQLATQCPGSGEEG
jgi:hypothetical protein